jgi:tetratricopeptide (TPR) repeat protein
LLAGGKPAKAVPHLQNAVEGEPEVTEWRFRLGMAQLALGQNAEALASLGRAAEMDEEYGYGAVQLRLSEAHLAAGDPEQALAHLDVFDRNHGPNPESAFRRGQALKKAGRRQEASESFARVGDLARSAAKFQRREAQKWAFRATLARLV